jgi:Zn-dependent protease
MKGALKLGRIAGIEISIHWTFMILIFFIIYNNYKAGNNTEQMLWSVLFVMSIFFTVFLHELGHSLAALKFGVKTKSITMLPIGGVASLERIPEKPFEELIVAIAGPAVNIFLAIITFIFIEMPAAENIPDILKAGVNNSNFFLQFFIVNIWLSIFNLIPAFPMDGGRVLRAMLSYKIPRHKATNIAARIGQFIAIIFIIIGFYTNPFLIFIGIFIILGAYSESEMVKTNFMLKGVKAKDVAMNNFISMDENETLDTAVKHLLNSQSNAFVILSGNAPIATLSREEIIQLLAAGKKNEQLKNIISQQIHIVDAEEGVEKIYMYMQSNKASLIAVYHDNRFLGVVDPENILEYIMVKNAVS